MPTSCPPPEALGGAVQGAEEDHAAARVCGDGLADMFRGFVAFGPRVVKEVGDVHTAGSRKCARPSGAR
jgi:hypothetical protein